MSKLDDSEKLRKGADELEKILKVIPYIVFQQDMTPADLRRIADELERLHARNKWLSERVALFEGRTSE